MRLTKVRSQRHRHLFFCDAKRKAHQGLDHPVATGHRPTSGGDVKNLRSGNVPMGV